MSQMETKHIEQNVNGTLGQICGPNAAHCLFLYDTHAKSASNIFICNT